MIKSLCTGFLVTVASLCSSADEFSVNRVLPVSSFEITSDRPYFIMWREICSNKDVVVSVYKSFISMEDGKEFRDPIRADYGFVASNECKSGQYKVEVPDIIPDGEYLYTPVASVNRSEALLPLPSERVIVKRNTE